MITVNELRVGNYIYYLYYQETKSIPTTVAPATFIDLVNHPEYYDPIPITPEILEKCGFERSPISLSIWCYTKLGLSLTDKTFYPFIEIGRNGIKPIGIKCKHLHSLQNLYYALTGEELNVQL